MLACFVIDFRSSGEQRVIFDQRRDVIRECVGRRLAVSVNRENIVTQYIPTIVIPLDLNRERSLERPTRRDRACRQRPLSRLFVPSAEIVIDGRRRQFRSSLVGTSLNILGKRGREGQGNKTRRPIEA